MRYGLCRHCVEWCCCGVEECAVSSEPEERRGFEQEQPITQSGALRTSFSHLESPTSRRQFYYTTEQISKHSIAKLRHDLPVLPPALPQHHPSHEHFSPRTNN